jgi:SAM-dependent methyltransferase
MSNYLYGNAHSEALLRLRGLEQIEDSGTIAVLERLPPMEGLTCLEIGAGAGSIAAWLASRVGPSGEVLATDIDVSHLDDAKYSVLRHDIERDDLPEERFDLVHVRHLLIHLGDPKSVLARLRGSLKPGGILVAEESDLRSWAPVAGHRQVEFQSGINTVLGLYVARGMNVALGGDLPAILSNAGFEVTHQDSASRTVSGGSAEAIYQERSMRQLADSTEDRHPREAEVLRRFADCLRDPGVLYRSRTTVSVSARRA